MPSRSDPISNLLPAFRSLLHQQQFYSVFILSLFLCPVGRTTRRMQILGVYRSGLPASLLAMVCVLLLPNVTQADCGWWDKVCGRGEKCVKRGYLEGLLEGTNCDSCSSGKYQDDPSHENQNCKHQTTSCGRGQKMNGNPESKSEKATCSSCDKGKYQDSSSHRSTSCKSQTTSCGAGRSLSGTATRKDAKNECRSCPEGEYKTGTNVWEYCVKCDPGRYQDEKGKGSCKLCPYGQFQDEKGAQGLFYPPPPGIPRVCAPLH